jgi:hypothetical protein
MKTNANLVEFGCWYEVAPGAEVPTCIYISCSDSEKAGLSSIIKETSEGRMRIFVNGELVSDLEASPHQMRLFDVVDVGGVRCRRDATPDASSAQCDATD